jgi:hypothetical protein
MNPEDIQPEQSPALSTAPVPPVSVAMIEALQQQCQDLRMLLNAACVALLFLTLAVNVFVGKQTRVVRDQLGELRPKFNKIEAEFQKIREPEYRRFSGRLQQYAMTHPDFQPIMDRYRAVLPDYFAASKSVIPAAEGGNPLAPAAPKRR